MTLDWQDPPVARRKTRDIIRVLAGEGHRPSANTTSSRGSGDGLVRVPRMEA